MIATAGASRLEEVSAILPSSRRPLYPLSAGRRQRQMGIRDIACSSDRFFAGSNLNILWGSLGFTFF